MHTNIMHNLSVLSCLQDVHIDGFVEISACMLTTPGFIIIMSLLLVVDYCHYYQP